MVRSIAKVVLAIFAMGAGMFVVMAASGLAGDGVGEVLGGAAAAADEMGAGFRKAGS